MFQRWALPFSDIQWMEMCHSIYRNLFPHTIHLVLSAPLQSVQTNHLGIQWEHKQKALHARSFHSAAPTLWNRLPDTLRCCIFSAAAAFFFLSTLQSPSCLLIPLARAVFAQCLLHPSSHNSFPTPLFPHHHQAQWACSCVHGIKLCYASGHWHWHGHHSKIGTGTCC